MRPMELRIGWLYGHEMNIYGDRGNVMALDRRASWRGIRTSIATIGLGEPLNATAFDLYFWGGGQDREQIAVAADLAGVKGRDLRASLEDGVPMLAVCGGYQLLGHYYRPYDGDELPGIGLLDVESRGGAERFIGNIVVDSDEFGQLVGFENHSALTFLGPNARPLGQVRVGNGNNGQDGTEGARQLNVIGCYLHGAILPKNPRVTDWLIERALERKYGMASLNPLDDAAERRAQEQATRRAVKLGR